MTSPTLPRRIKFDDIWPAIEIRDISHHGVCRHCDDEIALFSGVTGQYAHTRTERSRCQNVDGFHLAAPVPTCPRCGGHDVGTDRTDPWADYTRCPCGWQRRYSLGD